MPVVCETDYYALLGVTDNCSINDIKKAFRQKVKELHPDVNPSNVATEEFKKLRDAYEILSNESLRYKYDTEIKIKNTDFRQSVSRNHSSPLNERFRAGRRFTDNATEPGYSFWQEMSFYNPFSDFDILAYVCWFCAFFQIMNWIKSFGA